MAADLVPGETEAGETGIGYRQMDVCDRDQVSSTLAAVVEEHGSLDLLVNNAGITRHRPLVDLTWEDWSAVVDVNLHGAFNCLQAAGRIMIERGGGVIVNIASVAAERGRGPGSVRHDQGRPRRADAVGRGRVGAARGARERGRPRVRRHGILRPRSPRARSIRPTCWTGSRPAGSPTRTRSARWWLPRLAAGGLRHGQVLYVDGGFSPTTACA